MRQNTKFIGGGLILLIIAILLFILLLIPSLVWSIIKILGRFELLVGLKKLDSYFLSVAYSLDLLGNVLCSSLLNVVLITPNGYQFGNWNQTISYVLGKNKSMNTLTKLGSFIARFLNLIDKNHVEKAVISFNKIIRVKRNEIPVDILKLVEPYEVDTW